MGLKRVMSVCLAVVMMSFCLGCKGGEEHEYRPTRDINVRGTASATLTPDFVTVELAVVTLDMDPVKSQAENDRITREVLQRVETIGIAPGDVQTGLVSLGPKWKGRYEETPVFEGYEAAKGVTLVLRDLSKYDALVSDLVKAGVKNIRSVRFGSTREVEQAKQVRVEAVRNAREKAEALAAELGEKIANVTSIQEEETDMGHMGDSSAGLFVADEGEGGPSVAPGTLTVTVRLSVTFGLAD